jgi:hypothetical protein
MGKMEPFYSVTITAFLENLACNKRRYMFPDQITSKVALICGTHSFYNSSSTFLVGNVFTKEKTRSRKQYCIAVSPELVHMFGVSSHPCLFTSPEEQKGPPNTS